MRKCSLLFLTIGLFYLVYDYLIVELEELAIGGLQLESPPLNYFD